MSETLHRITIDGSAYYIFTNLSSDITDFSLTLTNGAETYYAVVLKREIKDMATKLDMDAEKYIGLLKECFCGCQSASKNNFFFELEKCSDDSAQCKLGDFALLIKEDASESILEIFQSLTNQLKSIKAEVSRLKSTTASYQTERKRMMEKMEEYADIKDSLEKDLYTKFSLVLNEKKAKIRELKVEVGKGAQVVPSSKRVQDDSATDDEDLDTDEERDTKNMTAIVDVKPVTSSNIILDDEIAVDDDKPKKNRKRMKASKPKTPLVPRTTSLPRPDEIAKEERASSSKRRKSREVSADDLLDEL